MRFAFGADDSNATTAAVLECLKKHGNVTVVDDRDQWPDIGREVGRLVATGDADLGVVMCWTGTGVTIAANKVPGVRAALAWDRWVATGRGAGTTRTCSASASSGSRPTSPWSAWRLSWIRPTNLIRRRGRTSTRSADGSARLGRAMSDG